jgi:hypothetical protein
MLVVGAVIVVQLNDGATSSGAGGFNNAVAPIVTRQATPPAASPTVPSSSESDAPPVPAASGRLPEAPLSEAGPGDVADLKPALRHAILAAIYAAKQDGVHLDVNSGYRTPAHQEELYQEGIAKYGSAQAAHAWVLPPDESDHVKGRGGRRRGCRRHRVVGEERRALRLVPQVRQRGLALRAARADGRFELPADASARLRRPAESRVPQATVLTHTRITHTRITHMCMTSRTSRLRKLVSPSVTSCSCLASSVVAGCSELRIAAA